MEQIFEPELLAQNPNLNYLVEPSFQGVNRLFVLAFENDAQRTNSKRCCLPNAGKNFIDQPVKNDKITYENIRKIAAGHVDD